MESAKQMIEALRTWIDLEDLKLDEQGQCTMAFDDELVLTFIADQREGLNVISHVADLEGDDMLVARLLLSRNFMPLALGGGRLALEPESNRVVLVHRWHAPRTEPEDFREQLQDYILGLGEIRTEWSALLNAADATRDQAQPGDQVPGGYI